MTKLSKIKTFIERIKPTANIAAKKFPETDTEQPVQAGKSLKKAPKSTKKKVSDIASKNAKMEAKTSDTLEIEGKTTSIVQIKEMSLEETQLAEQLYNSAGLDPVVDAGLKDYDKRLQLEDKLINKMLGTRVSDLTGYGEAVAKRVAFAVFNLLNKQYGGKVGDLRSYILSLEDERNRANTRYDELMGRVVGILGDEYKELRTDSNTFMEKLTTVLGEDVKESRINHKALAEKLADIDGLRSQIKTLSTEQEKLKEKYESQIADRDTKIGSLKLEKTVLSGELEKTRGDYNQLNTTHEILVKEQGQLKTNIAGLAEAIPYEDLRKQLVGELHDFLLKDSKVPNAVIDGVGKFIDFEKYLGIAVERGAKEACNRAEDILGKTPGTS